MSIRIGSVVTILLLVSGVACPAEQAGGQSGALGSAWADAAKMPDLFSGMWGNFGSFVEDDEKLNVPFTAKAQRYVDTYKHKRDIPHAQEGCMSPGLPIAMRQGGGNKFTYAPGLISIYMQSVGHTRFIKMNQPMGKTSPKYYGNSVGRWEGDTLVVETVDFLPEISFQYGVGEPLPLLGTIGTANLPPPASVPPGGTAPRSPPESLSAAIWGPHGEGMRMVERMRLVNPETLEVNLTVYDDTVWTKPYVATPRHFTRVRKGINELGPFISEPEENICTVSITTFDPDTNTYSDKDPEEIVKYLDKLGR
jgi:hypothetical protein